jgi:Ni,Fe-hydrogenase I cytochrome b subunit
MGFSWLKEHSLIVKCSPGHIFIQVVHTQYSAVQYKCTQYLRVIIQASHVDDRDIILIVCMLGELYMYCTSNSSSTPVTRIKAENKFVYFSRRNGEHSSEKAPADGSPSYICKHFSIDAQLSEASS